MDKLDKLLETLADGDDLAERLAAARAVGELGASGRKALPYLIKILDQLKKEMDAAAGQRLAGYQGAQLSSDAEHFARLIEEAQAGLKGLEKAVQGAVRSISKK